MRVRILVPLVVVAGLLVSSMSVCAMSLRDMPPWLRDMIEPVHLGTGAETTPSEEPVGVHIWAPEQAPGMQAGAGPVTQRVGFTQPGTERVSIGGGDDAPAASPVSLQSPGTTTTTAVRAQGISFGAPETQTVRGAGAPAPTEATGVSLGTVVPRATGGVRALRADEALTGGGVTILPMAAEWDEVLGSIEGLDRETLAQGGQLLAMIREQYMSPGEFAEWVKRHQTTPEVLTAGLLIVGVHRHENYPIPQPEAIVLATGLEALAGEGLSQVEVVPPFGRLWLAILLGRRGDEAGALIAFDSMSDEQLATLPHETGVMAIAHLMADVPGAAISAIKRYGSVTKQEAAWCFDLMVASEALCERRAVETDVIPFARAALEAVPRSPHSDRALMALVWGHLFLGDTEAAATEGTKWLTAIEGATAARSGYALWCKARIAIALVELNRMREACSMVPPEVETVYPDTLRTGRSGESPQVHSIAVIGSPTLCVEAVGVTCDYVSARVTESRRTEDGSQHTIAVLEKGVITGEVPERGEVRIKTNDPQCPHLTIPLICRARPEVRFLPGSLLVASLHSNHAATGSVHVTAALPFEIRSVTVDRPQLLSARVERVSDTEYRLLGAPVPARDCGPVKGTITIEVDGDMKGTYDLPYYVHVVQ